MSHKKDPISRLIQKKIDNEQVVGITAYNYWMAKIAEESGIDWILIGDSAGTCEMGYNTTIPVTMEDMIVYTKAATGGVTDTTIIADMPFLSFQTSKEEAIRNAGIFMRLGASGVKVEGADSIENIEGIVEAGIPVMGHIGLNPQYYFQKGGYRVTGKGRKETERLIEDGKKLEEAGVFALILESIVPDSAQKLKEELKVPLYGIGAGGNLDGQILVVNDVLGLSFEIKPKFAKKYADLHKIIGDALKEFRKEVIEGKFPDSEHTY